MNEQTCSNCQHYHEHNPHENWGKCNQLRVTAETTILAKSQPRAYTHPAFVFADFGCNEWQTKTKEIDVYVQKRKTITIPIDSDNPTTINIDGNTYMKRQRDNMFFKPVYDLVHTKD